MKTMTMLPKRGRRHFAPLMEKQCIKTFSQDVFG